MARPLGLGVLITMLAFPSGASALDGRGLTPHAGTHYARLADVLGLLCDSSLVVASQRELAARRLLEFGPATVPTLFALLTGAAPVPDSVLADGPLMTPAREALILDTLRAWDAGRVAEELADAVESEPDLHSRLVALELLGEVTGSRGLDTLFDLVEGIDPRTRAHPNVTQATTRALRSALEADHLSFVVLGARMRRLERQTVFLVVDALGQVGSPEAIESLDSIMSRGRSGRTPGLDARILGTLAELDQAQFMRSARRLRDVIAPYVRSRDESARREALRCVERLRDFDQARALIELLGDHDRVVVAGSVAALQAISGKKTSGDAEHWRAWFEAEALWLDEEAPALLEQLSAAPPAQAVKLMRELALHPALRESTSSEIARLLRSDETASATFAARTLGQLGASSALQPLIDALFDSRPEVRDAAAASLRRITGAELDDHAHSWRAWLEG